MFLSSRFEVAFGALGEEAVGWIGELVADAWFTLFTAMIFRDDSRDWG